MNSQYVEERFICINSFDAVRGCCVKQNIYWESFRVKYTQLMALGDKGCLVYANKSVTCVEAISVKFVLFVLV